MHSGLFSESPLEIPMSNLQYLTEFCGDQPAAAEDDQLPDRRELALVAVERSRTPMVVTDPRQPHNPIILANQAFIDLTGYASHEIIGQNCRFLQGKDTRPSDVETLRTALAQGEDTIELELLNYRKDGTSFTNALMISAVRNEQGELLYYFASQTDVTAERRSEELEASERRLLMEVDHRTMNALALVQSIVCLSRAENADSLSRSINRRVVSLARTHQLLARQKWRAVQLADLVEAQCGSMVGASRVILEGEGLKLPPRLVQPLGLVIHELLSNAQIHGALTAHDSAVRLSWSMKRDVLRINWKEAVSAHIQSPLKEGFGLQIVRTVIEQQLGGHWDFNRFTGGLDATITIPDANV